MTKTKFRIKFKALVFVYKTTTGSAHLNSLLQTYVPLGFHSASERCIVVKKRHKITFTDFYLNCWWKDLPNII